MAKKGKKKQSKGQEPKGKKNTKDIDDLSDGGDDDVDQVKNTSNAFDALNLDDNDDNVSVASSTKSSKKKKKKKGKNNDEDYLAMLAQEDDVSVADSASTQDIDSDDDAPVAKSQGKKNKKNKKKKGKNNDDDYLAMLAQESEPVQDTKEVVEEEVVDIKSQSKKSKKNKKKKGKNNDDDYLSMMAEQPLEEETPVEETPKNEDSKSKKKDKKKKKKDDDYLAMMAQDQNEEGEEKQEETESKSKKDKKKKKKEDKKDTKKDDKKDNKKKDKKDKKDTKDTKKKGPPKKALNSKLAKIREEMERKKQEEELLRQEEEERMKQEEEERKIFEEQMRIESEKKREEKKEKEKEKKRLKKQGKVKTKKQIEAEKRKREALEAMMREGLIAIGEEPIKSGEKPKQVEKEKPKQQKPKKVEKKKVEKKKQKDEDDLDDWEDMLDEVQDKKEEEKKDEEEEEDWENEIDEEEEDKKPTKVKEEQTIKEEKEVKETKKKTSKTNEEVKDNKPPKKEDLRSPICCVLGHVDTGKCFAKGTPILMYDGSIKNVEDVENNDLIMGDDNTSRRVSGTTRGKSQMFRIVPQSKYGAKSFVCNDEHILVLRVDSNIKVNSLRNQFKLSYNIVRNNRIMRSTKVFKYPTKQFKNQTAAKKVLLKHIHSIEKKELVNYWQPSVTEFLKAKKSIQEQCSMFTSMHNIEFGNRNTYSSENCRKYNITSREMSQISYLLGHLLQFNKPSNINCRNLRSLTKKLEEANLSLNDNTFSSIYNEFNSDKKRTLSRIATDCVEIRKEFISGLLENCEEVINQDKEILESLVRISRSCGYSNNSIQNNKETNMFSVRIEKKNINNTQWKFKLENLTEDYYYGFILDGNHRFLLGDYTITHNTSLLDKIRSTNVQLGEAGGITQQIGATYIPMDAVKIQTKKLDAKIVARLNFKVPGLLIIDTPGHESFTNLRSRGSSLCDIAVLVVDIMHGLERQTIESIQLLRQRKTPFIVALNKVDQLYGWKKFEGISIKQSLKQQETSTMNHFEDRLQKTITYFAEQSFNAIPYYKNKDFKKFISLVPTSAHTGEGIPDLLMLMVQMTQSFMSQKITYKSETECTILEVKVIEGHGTTIDVVLVNGIIREGDTIVVCGLNGPIVTSIRALLTPKPMREIRVKGEYVMHKEIKAAQGIKIAANGLDGAVPGSALLVAKEGDDIEDLKDMVMKDLDQMLNRISKSGRGVYVQASTLGSLEALLEFLKESKIPVSGINIGDLSKKDVTIASTMLDSAPEYAVILAFDIKVPKDIEEFAITTGVKVFRADIIYHLFDEFTKHREKVRDQKKKDTQGQAVWPCIIQIKPGCIFHNKDPITIGVDVIKGKLKVGTPLIVPSQDKLKIGKVHSIEYNKTPVQEADQGKAVAIQLSSPKHIQAGRHFLETDTIYSEITRKSLDLLKLNFKDELQQEDLRLIVELKKILDVK